MKTLLVFLTMVFGSPHAAQYHKFPLMQCPPVAARYYTAHDVVGDPQSCFMYEYGMSTGTTATGGVHGVPAVSTPPSGGGTPVGPGVGGGCPK